MSQNENDHDADDLEANSAVPRAKKHDSGAADLERVTDYAEETEITGQRLTNVSEQCMSVWWTHIPFNHNAFNFQYAFLTGNNCGHIGKLLRFVPSLQSIENYVVYFHEIKILRQCILY